MRSELIIKANGISISYEDSKKEGTPIIFIHGFPFNRSTWEIQYESLKENYRVLIYDIRGFGNSDLGKDEVSINLYADDLMKFMDALKIDKAIVCGLSMGGYILLNAAERYKERFKGLILSDTQCIADSTENKEKRFETIKDIQEKGLEGFADNFVKKLFSKQTQESKTHLSQQIKSLILSNQQESVTSALQALANRAETCSGLQQIKIPTLIICGEEDELTPKKQSETLHQSIPESKLKIIQNAAHLSNLEQSEEFNTAITDFLKEI